MTVMTFEERCQKFSDAVALLLHAILGRNCGFAMIIIAPDEAITEFRVLTNLSMAARIKATELMLEAWTSSAEKARAQQPEETH